ncbi:MAG: ABC transporter substrate-binding protein, partial [Eubacteriales bacterium]
MKGKLIKKITAVILVFVLALSSFVACSKVKQNTVTPLVVGYSAFSQKFSPFFAESGYDMDVANMTQLSLMTTDRVGGIIYKAIDGETVKYNGTDYIYKGICNIDVKINKDAAGKADTTVYTMTIRDDVKFSNGEKMTADDIIFNYYVLCDPTYTGSSTVYSSPIIGMKNYRYNNSLAEVTTADTELANPSAATKAEFVKQLITPLLTSEFEWVKSIYADKTTGDYGIDLKNSPTPKDGFYLFYGTTKGYDTSKKVDAAVLKDVIAEYGSDYVKLATAYGDPAYFDTKAGDIALKQVLAKSTGAKVPNIAGIKKISPTVVEVTTKGFDASAVYSICGIQVAPLSYYGDKTTYDYDNNKFGFTRGDLSKIEAKTTTPVGAGAYKFVKYENKVVYFEANDDFYKGAPATKYIQFKETTEADKISGVGTGTIDITDPSGSKDAFKEIADYNSNKKLSGDKLTTSLVDNLGYGYIGINAATMNVKGDAASTASKDLRKAFATIFSAYRETAIGSYYGEAASIINYPISSTSWAAPQKSDEGYRIAYSLTANGKDIYISALTAQLKITAALEATKGFFIAAGYTFDAATGKFTAAPAGAKLSYEIIIPADGKGDHPSFAILTNAKKALASIGITLKINDPADSNILWDKLSAGTQEMWTAAWGATIDPDMYQIYHSSNIAPNGTGSNYYHIKDATLDKSIMAARESDDKAYRKATYKACLDIILDWGVEVPVYQRQNCILFSTLRVNMATVTP